ncbi:hypothetical protein A2331_03900 [Candidatus Falkowbacteria bacterium RIFOXYB2_FULL_34_18]|uniref:Uncharacterized protein n=1 Tax=Candidatus Falkowbacteria bacterium RIFOXYD2_FULL_34_120 TaxID=1798007 RepID=A0A1F5TPM7_9BACT|nr:MAG: hypothetical protein A2331_03900 [Candidatus Falkowbacteria bacterium RIFOXYB2_FULL_34_18]OGF29094.1 MAG: hypothetical protein A2500_03225 [Candidatus Falkowbacteria bacterium RIFOXYC12_FULL_34_55]OGF36177.1 MAG: hypothetical protein A2466_04755 [Candidatus Falkowbacteria bacterium RIFOXYC2_FULL_34_220]OGF38604.1 MAG: hypothetical protein A2515_02115 [Candidatus Falkowbacteria bacterium RIFOXYD12_FULL_34_57]OGF40787.1 MAG: hypothetical protein A2531_06760 [Candidatus Falkowbacteria bact
MIIMKVIWQKKGKLSWKLNTKKELEIIKKKSIKLKLKSSGLARLKLPLMCWKDFLNTLKSE